MLYSSTGAFIFLSGVIQIVSAFPSFQEKIPNGDRVPHPIQTNFLWKGVGHKNPKGSGENNPFGLDFKRNGYIWDECLCRYDSDGDGKTNGEELGDPECVWKPNTPPARNTLLSHPGICEPVDSEKCLGKNDIVDIDMEPFDCPATKKEGVFNVDMRFPVTKVPGKDTVYMCHYMRLPMDTNKTYHIIAYEPIIDNVEIMHHTLVYGCKDDELKEVEERITKENITEPMECNDMECSELVLLWTVGINGACYPESYGALIGEGGYKSLYMEHHWNNPSKKTGMTDSSGVRLYYTEDLRDNDFAHLLWGPMGLEIPVGTKNFHQSGGCPSECTSDEDFPEKFNIVEIIPHMHLYGRTLTAYHIRPGVFEKVILEENNYNYDAPIVYKNDPPIEFQRGDEIRVNCSFTTTSASAPTYFGLGTYDEMCFAIMAVYPFKRSIPTFCQTNGGKGFCKGKRIGNWGECSMSSFFDKAFDYYFRLIGKCDTSGLDCQPGCTEALEGIFASEPCLKDMDLRTIIMFLSARSGQREFVNMITSCHPSARLVVDIEDNTNNGVKQENSLCPVADTTQRYIPTSSKPCNGDQCAAASKSKPMYFVALSFIALLYTILLH